MNREKNHYFDFSPANQDINFLIHSGCHEDELASFQLFQNPKPVAIVEGLASKLFTRKTNDVWMWKIPNKRCISYMLIFFLNKCKVKYVDYSILKSAHAYLTC